MDILLRGWYFVFPIYQLQESSDGYGWWQTPTMGNPLKRFAFLPIFLFSRFPWVETVGYVVHQPHLYGTVFPLVECLSPTI